MRRGLVRGLLVAAVALLVGCVSSAMAQAPENSADLGTQTGFARFAVDSAHGHVFVSEPQAGAVAELSAQGQLLTTITGLPGAWGMAIDGDYLYIAAQSAGEVARVDLRAAVPSAETFVSGLSGPTWLAFAAGKLWIGTAPQATGDSSVIAVDPLTKAERNFGGTFYGADFATSPADPNALYMAEAEEEPAPLHRYDLQTFPPRETASNPGYWSGAWGDMVLSADGSRLDAAVGGDRGFQELCSQTLRPDGVVYPGSDYPAAVASSAPGLLATGLAGYNSPNLAVYKTGEITPFWTTTSSAGEDLEQGGVALSSDGNTLYAAVEGTAPGGPALVIETYALPQPSSRTVSNPCPMPVSGADGAPGDGAGQSGATAAPGTAGHSARALSASLRASLRGRRRRPAAAFLLKLTLRPRSVQRGYNYTIALTHLQCVGGANKVLVTFAHRRENIRCAEHAMRWAGRVAAEKRYTVIANAEHRRGRREMSVRRNYTLVLRMPR